MPWIQIPSEESEQFRKYARKNQLRTHLSLFVPIVVLLFAWFMFEPLEGTEENISDRIFPALVLAPILGIGIYAVFRTSLLIFSKLPEEFSLPLAFQMGRGGVGSRHDGNKTFMVCLGCQEFQERKSDMRCPECNAVCIDPKQAKWIEKDTDGEQVAAGNVR